MEQPSSKFSHGFIRFGYYDYNEVVGYVINVVTFIIICFGLPLTLVAIYSLYSLVQKDHVAPIYVINLLISDLIQVFCMVVWVAQPEDIDIYGYIFYVYYFFAVASVCFMVCIALERYLAIAWPLWYRFRRTIKISVVVSAVIWAVTLVYLLTYFFWVKIGAAKIISAIFFLLPLPLFIFFLGGSLKALSASIAVPSDEKRRIVGILVLVLLNYTLLHLPSVFVSLEEHVRYNKYLMDLSLLCLRLSPLADLFLYVFMRKGAVDKLLASMCCCRLTREENQGQVTNEDKNNTEASSV
ncbi:G-protein coupled receptor 4-like [Centropristis striata]|uniref:G-protein coupled receptor 4-like n=1 Tax=Centropristis striata TaxID=184440 RepID=UPI0027E0B550|nr:G-protein coupled receptor 4-like [Centropristis striata]